MGQTNSTCMFVATCLVCRTLGIPARSVTNFASAHDTDASMTIDNYFNEELEPIDGMKSDSVWSAHFVYTQNISSCFIVVKLAVFDINSTVFSRFCTGIFMCGMKDGSAVPTYQRGMMAGRRSMGHHRRKANVSKSYLIRYICNIPNALIQH